MNSTKGDRSVLADDDDAFERREEIDEAFAGDIVALAG